MLVDPKHRSLVLTSFLLLLLFFLIRKQGWNFADPCDLLFIFHTGLHDSQVQKSTDSKVTTTSEQNFKVVGRLSDRSNLSDEMKDLCAGLPIYRMQKMVEKQNDADEMEDDVQESDGLDAPKRVARGNKMIKWRSSS